jgi:glycine betaine/proline transport system ATP-binding protein
MSEILVDQVYKVFGNKEKEALAMVKQGVGKSEILHRTGCTVGLNNVSLSIGAGEIFVIMGLSGSGKSTLVRHFNRLIEPSGGEILYRGKDVLKLNHQELLDFRRRSISMVFQSFGLLPHRDVLDNVAYGLKLRGETKATAHQSAMKWIDAVGLKGYEKKHPHELSGGMRQRVGLARALAADTDVMLMDEAFSALDPLIRHDMQDLLLQLQAQLNKTIVFITHDLDEALRIGAKIAILRDGCVVQVGTTKDILERPADDYVRRFVEKRTD